MADKKITFDLLGRDRASQAFKSAGAAAEHTHSRIRTLAAGAAALGLGGVVALGGFAAAGVAMGVKTAASLQQAEIAFETLLGSGQKSKAFLTDLKKFSASTPFELPGLVDSSRLLLGVGLEAKQVIPTLQDFGDAAGALGIQQEAFNRIMLATSQAISAGKFNTGDLNQIVEAGIPVWSLLSKAMGKPVPEIRKLAEGGKLLADDVLPLLRKQMHQDYGGAMAKQSQTLSGLWSTFMDTLNLGMASAIQPLIPVLQRVLPGAMEAVGDGLAVLSGWLAKGVDWLGRLRQSAKDPTSTLGGLGQVVQRVAGWFRNDLWPALQRVAAGVLPGLRKAIQTVRGAFDTSTPAGRKMSETMRQIGSFITVFLLPVLGRVARVALPVLATAFRVVAAAVTNVVWPALRGISRVFLGVVGTMVNAAAKAFGWVPGVGPKLKRAAASFNRFRDDVNRALGGIKSRTVSVQVRTTGGGTRLAYRNDGSVLIGTHGAQARAKGGPVRAGRSYLVGENEPEMFVPAVNGRILNQRQLGAALAGGGRGDVFHINVTQPLGTAEQIARVVVSAMIQAKGRVRIPAGAFGAA